MLFLSLLLFCTSKSKMRESLVWEPSTVPGVGKAGPTACTLISTRCSLPECPGCFCPLKVSLPPPPAPSLCLAHQMKRIFADTEVVLQIQPEMLPSFLGIRLQNLEVWQTASSKAQGQCRAGPAPSGWWIFCYEASSFLYKLEPDHTFHSPSLCPPHLGWHATRVELHLAHIKSLAPRSQCPQPVWPWKSPVPITWGH